MRKLLILFIICAFPLQANTTDTLLDQLAKAETRADANRIVSSIWTAWLSEYSTEREHQLMEKGISAMESRRFQQAEALFTSIIKSNPDYTEAWNKRATVRFYRGDFVGSEADILQVLLREPRHFGAISGLGLINMHLNEPEKALNSFRLLLEINPFSEDAEAFIPMIEGTQGVTDL